MGKHERALRTLAGASWVLRCNGKEYRHAGLVDMAAAADAAAVELEESMDSLVDCRVKLNAGQEAPAGAPVADCSLTGEQVWGCCVPGAPRVKG
jgi:hypothetical protein